MKKVVLFIAGAACATGAYAQQAPAPTVDLAGSLKAQHLSIRKFLAGAAEKMPEADFHFKPQGTAPDVRTFGQIVAGARKDARMSQKELASRIVKEDGTPLRKPN